MREELQSLYILSQILSFERKSQLFRPVSIVTVNILLVSVQRKQKTEKLV